LKEEDGILTNQESQLERRHQRHAAFASRWWQLDRLKLVRARGSWHRRKRRAGENPGNGFASRRRHSLNSD
jgi:hypothetical protein